MSNQPTDKKYNVLPFNRTSMESKLTMWTPQQTGGAGLLIEPVWNRNFELDELDLTPVITFNRTSMESKQTLFCYAKYQNPHF